VSSRMCKNRLDRHSHVWSGPATNETRLIRVEEPRQNGANLLARILEKILASQLARVIGRQLQVPSVAGQASESASMS
jgi:hypothetical protein